MPKILNKNNKIEFIKEMVKMNATQSYSGTSSGIVALAAAKAASLLKSKVFYTTCFISPYLYLNSAHIAIPKLGRCGLRKILATGLVLQNPEKGLHVMGDLTTKSVREVNKMVKNPTLINVEIQYKTQAIYCRVIAVDDQSNVADVTILNNPTDFASVKFNNKESIDLVQRKKVLNKKGFYSLDDITDFVTCREAYELCKELSVKDLSFLEEHIKLNQNLCHKGMLHLTKESVYKHYEEAMIVLSSLGHNFSMKEWTYRLYRVILAGIDARMCGFPMPTMTSATNGDHGIVAIMMPYLYGKDFNIPKDKIYQSILLSHFITWKISMRIGKLAGMCGTAVAAVAGGLAGIAYQNNWDWEQTQKMLNMHVAQQAGSICYGSSPICAFKVFAAIMSGLFCFELAANGGCIPHRDGIVHKEFVQTLDNMKKYSSATNDEVVNSLVETYQSKFNKRGK